MLTDVIDSELIFENLKWIIITKLMNHVIGSDINKER